MRSYHSRLLLKSMTCLIVAAFVFMAGPHAQASLSDPRALALGGAYTTLAKGSEALHWNPANLRFNRVPFEVSLPFSGGLSIDNSYFSLNRLLLEPITYESGEDFLADISGNRFRFSANGALHSGMNIGALGLSMRGEGSASVALSEGATRLFTVGSKPGASYSMTGTSVETAGLMSLGAGFAFYIPRVRLNRNAHDSVVSFGTNIKTYHGLFYANAKIDGTIDVSELAEYKADLSFEAIHTDFDKVYNDEIEGPGELAGKGYGVDFGITARTGPHWTFGLAVTNAISSMTWRDLIKVNGTFQGDLLSADDDGPVFPENPDDFTDHEETPVSSLTQNLPRTIRAGASYRPSPQIVLAADIAKTFGADKAMDPPLSLHLGAEFTPFAQVKFGKRLALRIGYEHSNHQSYYSYGVGFGLWKWEIDAGARIAQSVNAVNAQGATFAVTSRIRF